MKRRALLLGCEEYLGDYSNVTSVPHDLSNLEFRLIQLNYEIIIYNNCTRRILDNSIGDFLSEAPCDSINIIYFTGHGFQNNGKNYLAPIDLDNILKVSDDDYELAGYEIKNIFNKPSREIKLILIIDACRSDFGNEDLGKYSELLSPKENSFIAYATQFNTVARYTDKSMSYFTESICNNITVANQTVNEIFNSVRSELMQKGYSQLATCVSALKSELILNPAVDASKLDRAVYNYIEKYANDYEKKYGLFRAEYAVFIEASDFFGISLLDTYYRYEKAINPDILLKDTSVYITFMNILESPYFSHDEFHTWYFEGRKIRIGEIPPLPKDLERKVPIIGKEFEVEFNVIKEGSRLIVKTNLPNYFQVHIRINDSRGSIFEEVNEGMIKYEYNESIKKVVLTSPTVNVMADVDVDLIGIQGRNLVGKFVKFNPVYGNMIEAKFEL